jgi:hypothetical protein
MGGPDSCATRGPYGAATHILCCCATRGSYCTAHGHRQPTTPCMADLTARPHEHRPTTPSLAPSCGRLGRDGACQALENAHQMITWGKTGFKVVPDHLILTAMTSSPTPSLIPTSACTTLVDPNWHTAMEDEYGALMSNGAWELVP